MQIWYFDPAKQWVLDTFQKIPIYLVTEYLDVSEIVESNNPSKTHKLSAVYVCLGECLVSQLIRWFQDIYWSDIRCLPMS